MNATVFGRASRGIVLAATLFAGCDGSSGAPDAATADGSASADGGTGPVDIPWLAAGTPPVAPPVLVPCPTGWREVVDGDVTTCDPYPEGGAATCARGEAHFPGELGCARVGAACPADGLPAELPTDRPVVFVLAGATGGDGTRAHPYGALTEVSLSSLAAGTIIALGRGLYDAPLRLARGLSVWGACVTETELTASAASSTEGVVTLLGSGSEVRNLSIRNARRPGVWVAGAGHGGALEGVWIEHVEMIAVMAANGGAITAHELAVLDTQPRTADALGGRALTAQDGGSVQVTRAVLAQNRETAVIVIGAGASLSLQDAAIRDTGARTTDRRFGRAMSVEESATAELTRVVVSGNLDTSLTAIGAGTALTLTDVVVRDTQPQLRDMASGMGLSVQDGAVAELSRVLFERNRDVGIGASGMGTVVNATDLVVRDTDVVESDGLRGRGIGAMTGAAITVSRAVLARNHDLGALGNGPGTMLVLSDVSVRDTASRRDATTGTGLAIQHGATGSLERVTVERSVYIGVLLDGDGTTSIPVTDLLVRDTASRESDGRAGRGLQVQRGITVDATRVLVSGNHEVGIMVLASGAELRASELVVQDSVPATCGATGDCGNQALGMGIGAYLDGHVSATHFAVRRSALCGLQLSMNGAMDLSQGEVVGSEIGACVQVPGYDLTRLSDGVFFRENGSPIQATELPVPDPTPPPIE